MPSTLTEARIARKAYERYAARGYAHGDDQADWFEAEAEIRASHTGRKTATKKSSNGRKPATLKKASR